MNEKIKNFFDSLLIEEQKESDEGKFGHYPFIGELTSREGKKTLMCFTSANTEIMLSIFSQEVAENNGDVIVSVDFPNVGDIMTDFISIFSSIDGKIEVNLFPYDNKTGKKLGHVDSGITHENFKKMVDFFVKKKQASHG